MSGRAFSARVATVIVAVLAGPSLAQAQQREATPNPTFALSPRGYVQFDVRTFPDWDVVAGQGRVSRPAVELRRARLGVDGNIKRLSFEFSVDPQDLDGSFVKDAYAQLRFSRGLRVRAGQFKAPGTRDYDASARNMDFLERMPLTLALGVGRDSGVRADGQLGRLRYEVGVFAGDGVRRDDRAGLTGASRVVLNLPWGLEIGGSYSAARTRSQDDEDPNGPALFSTSGFRFADGLYVQGIRQRIGADAEWSPGRWRFTAEYLRLHDERHAQGLDFEDLPAVVGTGASASVVYRVRTRKDPSGNRVWNALLRRPVDVSVRYDYLGLDDVGTFGAESVRPRATNVRAKASHGVIVGSRWNINPWLRVLGNLSAETFTDRRSAPVTGKSGTYLSLAARLQVEWP